MIANLAEHIVKKDLNFKEIEELLFKFVLKIFQHLMVKVLEFYDKKLMKNRDKARYEIKEINQRTIQALVGEITFKRRYYRDKLNDCWVYLLDETLQLEANKSIGPGLLSLGVEWATKGPSYRDARDRISDLYGSRVVSHEAIRQALLEVGAVCQRETENKIVRREGDRAVDAIFIEVDGFNNRLQKNKNTKAKNRSKEAKMAIIHEGWIPRTGGKQSDYRLAKPHYISNLEEAEDFWEHARGYINAHYKDLDKTLVIINGDGASWIREGANFFARSMYQYDRFHVARDIRNALRNDKITLGRAMKAFRRNDVGKLLTLVTVALVNCTDEDQKEKLGELHKMLLKNHEYIVDYRIRLKEKGIEVNKNWRGLGAAESNVNKFKNRTGKRGRAWSYEGLTAILTTLSEQFGGNLRQSISRTLKERESWLLDQINSGLGRLTSNSMKKSIDIKRVNFPATRHGTQGYSKLFREISRIQFD